MQTYQTHDSSASGVSDSNRKLERLGIPQNLSGASVLDIGCNEGFFSAYMANHGAKVTAIDYTKSAIEFAKIRYGSLGIDFRHQSWTALPEGPFDLILWTSAMHYEPDPGSVLRKIERILAPDGLFVLECGVRDKTHRKEMELVQRYSDALWFPTMSFLTEELLSSFAARQMTQGEKTGGDPTPRYVFHCTKRLPVVLLVRGRHRDGKTSLTSYLSRSTSKIVSLDHFVSRLAASPCHHSDVSRMFASKQPLNDLGSLYREIDERGLTEPYVNMLSQTVTPSDRFVVFEGDMTDPQAQAIEKALNKRAIVWDARRMRH